ncbi:NAD(P)H-binding protein [Myxococcus sp. K15C18031901]|uniref:NAD(P)-dependent oxidoreductase n=1 Tax=Myxococcus dinghuensis TaxID=2906761 RepID=UPI0020A70BDB|nr:NAD(P)H-binding protein [Myxococcus dinghuensis]MCP3102689.1 NAD(P)H-binding protein [Myxococcus dinghuensis]
MHIGIIGATGNIGQRIVAEALGRNHHVTALTRHPSRIPPRPGPLAWRVADIHDVGSLVPALGGLDVLVSAYGPGNASLDPRDTVERSVQAPEAYVAAAKALLEALRHHPPLRLLVVGGAGSLEVRPGVQLVDTEDFEERLKKLGLPAEYKRAVLAHRDALNLYRTSNRHWTYFSPAGWIGPGERTGRFRLGEDQLVVDANGDSRISYEDYALALVDELERPRFHERRFTIGY